MDATEVVAVAGAITTPAVAIAGYIFSERRSNTERAAARELAEGQREHEDRLRRSDRHYDARREIYLDVLRQFLVEQQIVERTENPQSSREPPEMPAESEWRELRARVDAFASPNVREAVNVFDGCVREFHDVVESPAGAELRPLHEAALHGRREEVWRAYGNVQSVISNELERF